MMMKKKEKNIVLLFLYFRFYIVVVCHGKKKPKKLNSCVAPLTKTRKREETSSSFPLCFVNISIYPVDLRESI